MSLNIRAHFDGEFIVPDEPVDLPINEPLNLEVTPGAKTSSNGSADVDPALIQARRSRLKASAGRIKVPVPSDEALRCENLYDDRV